MESVFVSGFVFRFLFFLVWLLSELVLDVFKPSDASDSDVFETDS